MNEKFEYFMKQIKKQMTIKIYFQLIISIMLIGLSIYLHFYYEDPFYTNVFIGVIGILLLITVLLMVFMRKKVDWMVANYQSHKEEVIDYLKIYLRNIEYSRHRNFLFRLSQRKEETYFTEAFKALTGEHGQLNDEYNE